MAVDTDRRFAVSILARGKPKERFVDGHMAVVMSSKLKHRLIIVTAAGETSAASLAKEEFAREYPDFDVWDTLVECTTETRK